MKKVLFIEDEAVLQKTVGDTLVRNGYEVYQALDGEIGVRIAHEKTPDLILLDLIMPRKNGFEVLEDLKKDPATKAIPVIVLTNLEGPEEIERVMSAGATGYLVKANYSLEEVLQKVRETIG